MTFAQQTRLLQWEVFHPKKNLWMAFGEKGSVQELLQKSGEIPDPFYGKNEHLYDWIEEYDWTFKTQFYLSEQEFLASKLDLVFPNIDTYGKIYLNGQFLTTTDNFHRIWRFAIKDKVQCGMNEIKVEIIPPVRYHKERFEKEDFHYPAPNDPHKIKAAPLTRKPQYQFGWDWALRMNTIGFAKPAFIEIPENNAIKHAWINTESLQNNQANLIYNFEFSGNQNLRLKSSIFGDISYQNGLNRLKVQLSNPKLWWPSNLGKPNLYEDTLKVLDEKGAILSQFTHTFGIRTTQLIQEKDQWGTSYVVQVNGTPVFCRGANYIPPSVFPASVTDEDYEKLVQQMKFANFNMVRVWGGGMYADDYFLRRCSEEGIMVWHDLMFACAMYPGDEAFLGTVKDELIQQIQRISAHASVVLINGNNEVDVAWKNWGFQSQYKLNKDHQLIIEKAYDDLFKKLAPTVIAQYTNIPFIHTSPLSNWGNDDFYNHGSQHYWGVWHGKDPMEDFARKIGRFNAEYGFQSFPEFSTLNTFSERKDWNLKSEVMKHHQKSYVGNGMIEKHAILLYGKPKTFEEFVYFSQLTQAHAVSSAVSGHRLDAPRCSGTIYWQLNDCWPAPTWSSLDFYNNRKALHFAVAQDFKDIAILSALDKSGKTEIFMKNDLPNKIEKNVNIKTFNLAGKLLEETNQKVTLDYQQSTLVWDAKKTKFNNGILIEVSYDNGKRQILVADKKSLSGRKPLVKLVDFQVDEVTKTGSITVSNDVFCADFWLYTLNQGIEFEENFKNLLPGKHVITFKFQKAPKANEFQFIYR